jgi:hypothetical protein
MRPVGRRLREICTIVEQLGTCSVVRIMDHTTASRNVIRVYCMRGVDKGVLTRDCGEYRVVRGWREILDEPEGKRIVPEYEPVRHVLDSWLSGAATFAVN